MYNEITDKSLGRASGASNILSMRDLCISYLVHRKIHVKNIYNRRTWNKHLTMDPSNLHGFIVFEEMAVKNVLFFMIKHVSGVRSKTTKNQMRRLLHRTHTQVFAFTHECSVLRFWCGVSFTECVMNGIVDSEISIKCT